MAVIPPSLVPPPRAVKASGPSPGCDPNQPTICAIPLKKGDVAPFGGQLITTDLAIRLGQTAAGCQPRIDAEVGRTKADALVDLQKEQTLHKVDVSNLTAEMADLENKLGRAEKLADENKPPFYAQPWFVAPIAAVLSGGVMVWALHH